MPARSPAGRWNRHLRGRAHERNSHRQERRDRETRGRRAESLAALLLRLKGYRVIGRRIRTPAGEIDIVIRRGDTIAFVEVKARRSEAMAADAVTSRQKHRIVRAAGHYLATRPAFASLTQRFDVVLVTPNRWPRHLISVWNESVE